MQAFPRMPAPGALLLTTALCGAHALGVSLGVAGRGVRDDLLTPLAFGGGGLDLGVRYAGHVGPGLLEGALDAGLVMMVERHGNGGAAIDWNLVARYLFPAGAFAVGPSFGLDHDVYYLYSWDNAHGYWLGARWIGVSARVNVALGDAALDLAGDVALAGFFSRPPEYRLEKQDPLKDPMFFLEGPFTGDRFGWLPDFQVLRLQADLHLSDDAIGVTSGGWALGMEARLTHAAEPAPIWGFELEGRISWAWSF